MDSRIRINVGCGATPTRGWLNYDNSRSIKLARLPALLIAILSRLKLLSPANVNFINFCKTNDIRFADACVRLPHRNGSVDAVYTSHMVEHLDQCEAQKFFAEAFRVLEDGGVLRVAVPDLRYHVDNYLASGDADRFMAETYLGRSRPRGFSGLLMTVLLGDRNHLWMYDERSLPALLSRAGFCDVAVRQPGETAIADPGDLDLNERVPESLFVEARKPSSAER